MPKLGLYIKTIPKLGISNVLYIIWYRLSIKLGIRKLYFPEEKIILESDSFKPINSNISFPDEWQQRLLQNADEILKGNIKYFSYHLKEIGNPPNWFLNPFNGNKYPTTNLHWTKLSDFNPQSGDIKTIWEASRFDWLTILARAYAITYDNKYLLTLNNWLNDWNDKNSYNTGPNWKCGQEASIRVFNLINTALILKQDDDPTKSLTDLIYYHLKRISPNIKYALAQDNNHGTSEAAALYIAGTWLEKIQSGQYPKANYYKRIGRKYLEDRINKLIYEDGSFSQHSVTYHRVLLDTLCIVELWREKLQDSMFSDTFYKKIQNAINWLQSITNENNGNAPNLGPNDGALFINLHSCEYRDFRPSIQLASVIFKKSGVYPSGNYDETLLWFGKEIIDIIKKPNADSKLSKGYAIIKTGRSWAMLRLPYFKFRPAHNDVFHFDLWYNGINILCDSGTYSYNPDKEDSEIDLSSVSCHNTVSFDNKEQMPKISRFLMANWLKTSVSKLDDDKFSAGYIDNYGNSHKRSIKYQEDSWLIEDDIKGNFKKAIIGFNINDPQCILKENILETGFGEITIPENTTTDLTQTYISEYYLEKHQIKRLNINVSKPGVYKTTIHLKK